MGGHRRLQTGMNEIVLSIRPGDDETFRLLMHFTAGSTFQVGIYDQESHAEQHRNLLADLLRDAGANTIVRK